VRGIASTLKPEGARGPGERGNPLDRDTTEGVPIVSGVVSARYGIEAVSVERVNARRTPQGARRASFPPVLEPARRCP